MRIMSPSKNSQETGNDMSNVLCFTVCCMVLQDILGTWCPILSLLYFITVQSYSLSLYHILYNGTNWLSSILQPLLLPPLYEMQCTNPTIWLFDKMVQLVCFVLQHATCSGITEPLTFIWNILDNDLQYVPLARSYTCCTF